MVMGVSERRSSPLARAQRPRIGRRNGSSAVGARVDWSAIVSHYI